MEEDNSKSDLKPQISMPEGAGQQTHEQPSRVLQLEVARQDSHLKISAHERLAGEESTIRHYEHMAISMDGVETRCQEMVQTLNKANRNGCLAREVLTKLREVGQVFYDDLLPISIKEKLKQTRAEYLSLYLDDELVHIPWELLHDGRRFLCQRFNMGRLVKTQQTVLSSKGRVLARPLKMLILADPEADLKGAYAEGLRIRDLMDLDKELIKVTTHSDNITTQFIREKIRNFDIVHFAGHADYDSQNPEESVWRLTGGSLNAQEIAKMAGTGTMPALIFSNACQSARTERWTLGEHFENRIFGLANAFLLAGVKHYAGTFWEILDEPSSRFALAFYKYLLAGSSTGEAIRLSRLELIDKYGEETIVWASYVLYGDPTSSYLPHSGAIGPRDKPRFDRVAMAKSEVRAPPDVIDFADEPITKKRRRWWVVAAGVIVAAMLFWGYQFLSEKKIAKYEQAALAYYYEGNFGEALNACNMLEEKRPEACLTCLIRGNIYLRKGKLNVAETAYQMALKASDGTDLQKADSLVGLGRIASLRKQPEIALKYYEQATEVAPQSSLGYLSQAMLFQNEGKNEEALDLLAEARKLAPRDQVLAALMNETRKKLAVSADREKQERIDRMVKELVESMKAAPKPLPSDGWTSLPLTLWVMDFETQGYSLQEGEERLLVSGIVDQVLQKSRVQLVERALLDKLLQELKLGTSKMIDSSTALSLGRMLAARLILSGQVVYSDAQTQVSMRLIETETGRITAAVNEYFGSAVPASVLTERLSCSLLERLEKLYPLRGKILKMSGEDVRLNIGQKAGVRVGERFKVTEEDTTMEITSVDADTSLAKIIKGEKALEKGLRVEVLSESNSKHLASPHSQLGDVSRRAGTTLE